MINKISLIKPNDMHVHFRDDNILSLVVPETDNIYKNCVVMPNTIPPITTGNMAKNIKVKLKN